LDYDGGCGNGTRWSNLDHFVELEWVGFDNIEIKGEKKKMTDDSQDPGLTSRLDA